MGVDGPAWADAQREWDRWAPMKGRLTVAQSEIAITTAMSHADLYRKGGADGAPDDATESEDR